MDISELIKAVDLALRPQALIFNPSDRAFILEAMPDIEDKLKLYEFDIIEKGTFYLIDREYIERYNGEA